MVWSGEGALSWRCFLTHLLPSVEKGNGATWKPTPLPSLAQLTPGMMGGAVHTGRPGCLAGHAATAGAVREPQGRPAGTAVDAVVARVGAGGAWRTS